MSFHRPSVEEFPYFKKYDNLSEKIDKKYLKVGCPKPDCIPSIDNPIWSQGDKINEEFDNDEEILVMILRQNQKIKTFGFPIAIMDYHEVVNFKTDIPLCLTYCPLCQTASAYKSQINGNDLNLGVSGLLYNSALILYDRNSLSLFSQVLSEGILGKFVEKQLTELPLIQTNIAEARDFFSNISILSRETGFPNRQRRYDSYPYRDYKEKPDVHFPTNVFDNELHPKEIVFKLSVDGENYIITNPSENEPIQHHDKFYSIPYGGGRLFFEGKFKTKDPVWEKWVPSMISFYFAARAYFPEAKLI